MEENQVKHWLKENWFKLGILIALIVLVGGVSMYLTDKSKLAEQERLDKIAREAETKASEEQAKIEQDQTQLLEQQKKDAQTQEQAQITAENKHWDNEKNQIRMQ